MVCMDTQPVSRGTCRLCKKTVWAFHETLAPYGQRRCKDEDDAYWHLACYVRKDAEVDSRIRACLADQ